MKKKKIVCFETSQFIVYMLFGGNFNSKNGGRGKSLTLCRSATGHPVSTASARTRSKMTQDRCFSFDAYVSFHPLSKPPPSPLIESSPYLCPSSNWICSQQPNGICPNQPSVFLDLCSFDQMEIRK